MSWPGLGPLWERLQESWNELRLNPGRSALQALGVILGVASVLGGFSITDSQRKRSEELFVKLGGLDKLRVNPLPDMGLERPTALQSANLGLRIDDARRGENLSPDTVKGVSFSRQESLPIRSPYREENRTVTGIGGDYLPLNGYAMARGRMFTESEMETGAPVAILGTEAESVFFPAGQAIGQVMNLGDAPVTIVGVFQERSFRFSEGDPNWFARRNRIVAVPAAYLQLRLLGDPHRRVDEVTFRIPEMKAMERYASALTTLLRATHRLQDDFRVDDVGKRVRKAKSQEGVYDLIFLLSGILALVGGGIVNINIQMASLKERVREVGLKMALGASDREIFKGFMTEAILLTLLGGGLGLGLGIGFSAWITWILQIPLHMTPASFLWATLLAAVFGFLFALYPAWKASRLSPMEALRYE